MLKYYFTCLLSAVLVSSGTLILKSTANILAQNSFSIDSLQKTQQFYAVIIVPILYVLALILNMNLLRSKSPTEVSSTTISFCAILILFSASFLGLETLSFSKIFATIMMLIAIHMINSEKTAGD